VDEVDCLTHLAEDPSTKVICMYLEGIWRGRKLLEAARRCHKPILMIKANRSTSGARAAQSHTAALASNERVVEAALAQSGVVRVNGIRSMALASAALLLPKMQGNRVAAMSLSGGLSVILADLCEELGFSLPLLDQDLLDDIEAGSRAGIIRLTNPLDTGDIFDNKLFVETVRRVISLPYIDAMIVAFPLRDSRPGETTRSESYHVARGIVEISRSVGKPIALSKMPSPKPIAGLMRDLEFPVFSDPEEATRALGVLWRYSQLSR
jgi:acetyltransferase